MHSRIIEEETTAQPAQEKPRTDAPLLVGDDAPRIYNRIADKLPPDDAPSTPTNRVDPFRRKPRLRTPNRPRFLPGYTAGFFRFRLVPRDTSVISMALHKIGATPTLLEAHHVHRPSHTRHCRWCRSGPFGKGSLQPFQSLVGSWKATGHPEGTLDERNKGMWVETIAWEWQFKGQKAWLAATFTKGKHFTAGKLEPSAETPGNFTLTLTTLDKKDSPSPARTRTASSPRSRTDDATKELQRIVISVLHDNRYLYRYETKAAEAFRPVNATFVGATKEGEPFANVPVYPECIVTGGRASSKVTYKGVDYYVCCSGCKTAFNEDPEKYIKEAAAKAKK